jgi:hypothetical protein
VVINKVDKFGAGFFLADKAQNVAVLVVRRGFAPPLSVFPLHAKACGKKATQSGEKKTSQMSNLLSPRPMPAGAGCVMGAK